MIHEVWLVLPIVIIVVVSIMLIRVLKELKKQAGNSDTNQDPPTFDSIDAGGFQPKNDKTP